MAYLLLLVAVLALVVVGVRFWMLKRSLRHTADQLWEIERDVANNRILKMELPDKDVEYLLSAINQVLTDVRRPASQFAGGGHLPNRSGAGKAGENHPLYPVPAAGRVKNP